MNVPIVLRAVAMASFMARLSSATDVTLDVPLPQAANIVMRTMVTTPMTGECRYFMSPDSTVEADAR